MDTLCDCVFIWLTWKNVYMCKYVYIYINMLGLLQGNVHIEIYIYIYGCNSLRMLFHKLSTFFKITPRPSVLSKYGVFGLHTWENPRMALRRPRPARRKFHPGARLFVTELIVRSLGVVHVDYIHIYSGHARF